jgi:ketosteroid isomerase-like protein
VSDATDLEAVLAADAARRAALVAADVDALAPLLDDELVFVHSSGNRDDKARVLAAVGSGAVEYRSIDLDRVVGHVVGDVAYLEGNILMEAVNGGTPTTVDARFLCVWVRSPDGWRLAAWQNTKRPER